MIVFTNILRDLRVSKAPAAGFMAVGLFWGSFAGLVPDIKATIGASDGAFGLAMLFASSGAVAAMWIAPRVDKGLGARAMQGAACAMALAFLLPGMATGVILFALGMLCASAASGATDVIMNTRVARIEAETGRSLMNLNHAMFSFAYAGAALCAGLFREAGFVPVHVFAVMLALTLVLVAIMYDVPTGEDVQIKDVGSGHKRGLIVFGGTIILIAFMAEQATEAWSALHLERGLGGSAAQGALGPAILGLTMGLGRLSGQVVAAHMRETTVIQIASLVAAAGLLIAANAPNLWAAYLGFGILGIGVSVIAPMAFSAVGKRCAPEKRAIVITRVSVVGYLGFFVGPPLMGGVSELFGLQMSFIVVAAILLTIAVYFAPRLRSEPVLTSHNPL
jgi:MFS family permease